MPRILIVGAGVSGLSLAYRLEQRLPAAEVQVLEAEPRPGGTAWTAYDDGWQVELGPNGFLDNKPTTLTLARDLGLGDRLVEASEAAGANRYLVVGQRMHRLPAGPGDLLRTPLLSWRGKLSFLAERFRRSKFVEPDESIDAFARRRAGHEVAETFADGLVTGIFAGDPARLSLPACFPRVAALERQHGSVIKGFIASAKERRREAEARGETYRRGSRLWSLRGGLRVLVEALTRSLKTPPIYGVSVRAIRGSGEGWSVLADGRDAWNADAVVLTCPAYRQAGILAELDETLADDLGGIPFNQVAVVGLGYRREDVAGKVDGFGFIIPQRQRRDLLGVQWCSSIFPGRAPDGMILMRAMCGGWNRPDVVTWEEPRLLDAVRAELRAIQGITAAPMFHVVKRWQPAIPQYHLGHLDRLARIDSRLTRHPGLFLGGNSYRGVALNDCTEQALILAERLAGYLA
jgi:oxygen-dependent protoporphyrinogen oxidase